MLKCHRTPSCFRRGFTPKTKHLAFGQGYKRLARRGCRLVTGELTSREVCQPSQAGCGEVPDAAGRNELVNRTRPHAARERANPVDAVIGPVPGSQRRPEGASGIHGRPVKGRPNSAATVISSPRPRARDQRATRADRLGSCLGLASSAVAKECEHDEDSITSAAPSISIAGARVSPLARSGVPSATARQVSSGSAERSRISRAAAPANCARAVGQHVEQCPICA